MKALIKKYLEFNYYQEINFVLKKMKKVYFFLDVHKFNVLLKN
jgi:hypothetical protein